MHLSVAEPPRDRRGPHIDVEPLLSVIKAECGLDFAGYRRASLARRVEKRLKTIGMNDVSEYHEFLKSCPEERANLIDAILIKVTRFFRDESSWTFLAETVVPDILRRKRAPELIRVWCAGCASGEEAFTLAMLFAEAIGIDAFKERVVIHGTDLDENALTFGRHARYTTQQLEQVPAALRQKYFRPLNGELALVREELRRRVRFHRHDIITDAPVVHVDLLSCRNTLMYLNKPTQLRVLERFHRSLNDGGILFLGRAETLLIDDKTFRPVDLKRRISTKVTAA